MKLESLISAAAGREKADILFINGKVINVFTGEILEQSVAVKDGYICGLGEICKKENPDLNVDAAELKYQLEYEADNIVDLQGMYLAPGFIDAHVHIESSMVTPAQFANGVAPFGTTTVIADPHEIANVMGIEGVEYMIKSAENQPMNILFASPSCVPATDMETSGATLDAKTVANLLQNEKIVALAEMMNYPGVIFTASEVMAKIDAAHKIKKRVDGHAPSVTGKNLNAYASAGIYSDHECSTATEALEKLRLGIHIMVREGTCAKNLDDLLPAINEQTWHKMMWCSDDRHPEEILTQGHIDYIIRKAIKSGINPVRAIQMATINCANYFKIDDIGAIAPKRRADLVVFKDIENPRIEKVFVKGVLVAENGSRVNSSIKLGKSEQIPTVMNFDLNKIDFSIKCKGYSFPDNYFPPPQSSPRGGDDYSPSQLGRGQEVGQQELPIKARVIKIIPNQIITEEICMEVLQKDGYALSDTSRDMIKIAVIERYSGKTGMAKGFVNGLGLKKGAIASTVAHDSHNIIVAGSNDGDMLCAVKAVKEMGGGFVIVGEKEVIASLPLPVAGLMSEESLESVNSSMGKVLKAAQSLGSKLSDPFMALGFLALPVIPTLKITDKGLVDVNKFALVELFC
ncbi:MAG: adenine deaminase [Desulfamplus sp.]|nr:adenine deaminase [Desulfamplus sp.]